MKYIVVIMMLFGLAACQNEEKTEAPVSMVEKHEPVNTQAVKKDDTTPAVVQKNVQETSQNVVQALTEEKTVANPCQAKMAMNKHVEKAAPVMNPCAAKKVAAKNPCTLKVKKMAVNPCTVKMVKAANPCEAKKIKSEAATNPCKAKKAVNANPCSLKAVVKVVTNFTAKCKACHKVSKDAVGPSFKKIQAAYGSSAALASVWESGFAIADRKVAASDAKYKKKAGMMTSQYKKLIKKKVESGKFTYQALADEVFSK